MDHSSNLDRPLDNRNYIILCVRRIYSHPACSRTDNNNYPCYRGKEIFLGELK